MTLQRDSIIGKKRPTPVLKVENVPGWTDDVWVRRVSARETIALEYIMGENGGKPDNWQARFVVLFASDEHGNRIFTDADAVALGDDPSLTDAIEVVVSAGLSFNGLTKKAREDGKKNSHPTPDG